VKSASLFPFAKAVRSIVVGFFACGFLYGILSLGMGLDTTGDEELDKELRVYVQYFGLKIPADWIVPPFVFVSAFLIAWIDARQADRREARLTQLVAGQNAGGRSD
jgi:hypothetical protein